MEPKAYKGAINNPANWRSPAGNLRNQDDIRWNTRSLFSLSPFLRGEGWGEGLSPRMRLRMDLCPLTRIASSMQSDLSPQAGRGKEEAQREYEMMRTE
ncbi:hypothetical protein PMI42_04326 [Bradyrhizobium sp. YR681]|nr:hypothetical protein PMI42_04326 [Bradyrhizobium sp. YR681]